MKLTFVALALALSGCVASNTPAPAPAPAPAPGPAPVVTPTHHAVGVTPVTDESGATVQISQGQPGDPAVVGCADGQREGFVDSAAFPTIAGCIGQWEGTTSLRAPRSGAACGDDLGACATPADACAPGWRVCGDGGALADVQRVDASQCEQAGGGRFVAAMSHCETQDGCAYDTSATADYACYENGWCSEPVCCGADCATGACPSGVWADKTHIAIGTDHGCGAMVASRARGVLCCR